VDATVLKCIAEDTAQGLETEGPKLMSIC